MNKDKKESLLKPYTNFDRIKGMTVDEMARFLDEVNSSSCSMICSQDSDRCDYEYLTYERRVEYCLSNIITWLESEVEE